VHKARCVNRSEALSQASRQRQHRLWGKCTVFADRIGKRWAGNIGRCQPWREAVRVGIDNERRKQAADLPRRSDFATEPDPEIGVGRQVIADDLHRD
jgi:hypothetical protein